MVDELSLLALREVTPKALPSRSNAEGKTEEAIAWYREHMNENPGLDEIARNLFVSPAHLRRLFHEARDEGPKSTFTRLRMERVEELLHHTDLGLEAIAPRVGFSSASALSRAVKAHFHASPREYRQRRQQH
jgi:AraC family transcriptional regulator